MTQPQSRIGKRPMTKFKTLALMIVASVSVGGCATSNCAGWKPLHPTKKDVQVMSDRLAGDILEHNEFGQKQGCWSR